MRAILKIAGSRAWLAILLGSLITTAVGCDDDNPIGPDDDVASVEFDAATESVEVGSTIQLGFEIRDQAGNLVDADDVTIDFTTSAAAVATVSASGLVTPVGPGTAVITIEAGGLTDTITTTVTPEISSIDIVDTDLDLVAGETTTLQVTVLDMAGNPVANPGLDFTSSEGLVASVDADGVVTALAEGMTTITTEGGGESDMIEVTVFAAGSNEINLDANAFSIPLGDAVTIDDLVVVTDDGGAVIPDAVLEFDVTNATVATVDAMGLLSTLASGETLVTVTSPDAEGSATFRLRVTLADILDTLTLDPAMATVQVGETVDIDASVETTGGDTIDDFLVVYSSSDETVATVNPLTGVVTGVAAGMATITGTTGGLMAESTITVE